MIMSLRHVATMAVLLALPSAAMAAGDISDALVKLSEGVRPLIEGQGAIIWAVCYALGAAMAVRTAYKLKQHGENPAHHPLSGVIASFLTTGALLAAPMAMDAVRATLGLEQLPNSALAYTRGGQSSMAIEQAIYIYAAFFGYIAFIRGVFILNKLGDASKRGDELGRGITHIIGAVAATNLSEIVAALKALFL